MFSIYSSHTCSPHFHFWSFQQHCQTSAPSYQAPCLFCFRSIEDKRCAHLCAPVTDHVTSVGGDSVGPSTLHQHTAKSPIILPPLLCLFLRIESQGVHKLFSTQRPQTLLIYECLILRHWSHGWSLCVWRVYALITLKCRWRKAKCNILLCIYMRAAGAGSVLSNQLNLCSYERKSPIIYSRKAGAYACDFW